VNRKRPRNRTATPSKVYLSPVVRGLMATLQTALAATGDPNLILAGVSANFVDVALATHMANRIEANREELSDRTEARLRRLEDGGRLDEKVLKDPLFHALVFQAAVAAAQESEAEKIEWYAAILAGAASRDRPPELNVRALLSSMVFLTAEEMRLARQFYEDFHQSKHAIVDGAPTPNWGPDTSLYLRRLESANLIVSQVVEALPARFQGTAGNYFVTSTFHRLMELVRQTDAAERTSG
jgi:hypothetical protein